MNAKLMNVAFSILLTCMLAVSCSVTVCNNSCYCFATLQVQIFPLKILLDTLKVFCQGSKNVNQGASRTRTYPFCILLITLLQLSPGIPFVHTLFSAAQCSPGFDSSPPLSSQDPPLCITSH